MTYDVILRSERYFYGDLFMILADFSVIFSIAAVIIEIVEPFILIFGTLYLKKVSVLIAVLFHIGILLTGTGTVYNLIYPILFWFLIYFGTEKDPPMKIDYFNLLAIYATMLVSIFYLIFLSFRIPSLASGFVEKFL